MILGVEEAKMITVFLCMLRVLTMIFAMPILGGRAISLRVKVMLGFMIGLIVGLNPTVPEYTGDWTTMGTMFLLVLQEVTVGFLIGFAMHIVPATVQTAAAMIGMGFGFGLTQIFDPQQQGQVTVIGRFLYWIFVIGFFGLNIHHALILLLVDSFQKIPFGTFMYSQEIFKTFAMMGGYIFKYAVSIASPLMILLLVSYVTLGIIGRIAPQMNIFFALGMSLNVVSGLFLIGLTLPYIADTIAIQLEQMTRFVDQVVLRG